MNKNITNSIIKTLCYAQIFSYPLTVSELWKYLIHPQKIDREEFISNLRANASIFEQVQQYIVLSGDRKLVAMRSTKTQESKRKLAKALWISQLLAYLPGIKLIAISGSLSMYNAAPADDIDLFFITKKNSLWTTRFLVNLVLLVLGEKRSRGEKYGTDKICPNMFISEDNMAISTRNLYTAHEVAQIKVLISKDQTFEKFLISNRWVLRFLPNAFSLGKHFTPKTKINLFKTLPQIFLEHCFYYSQVFYMKRRITNEKVKKKSAAFHPLKREEIVMTLYKLKLKAHRSIFYDVETGKENTSYSLLN